jgi:hypothetical protein
MSNIIRTIICQIIVKTDINLAKLRSSRRRFSAFFQLIERLGHIIRPFNILTAFPAFLGTVVNIALFIGTNIIALVFVYLWMFLVCRFCSFYMAFLVFCTVVYIPFLTHNYIVLITNINISRIDVYIGNPVCFDFGLKISTITIGKYRPGVVSSITLNLF